MIKIDVKGFGVGKVNSISKNGNFASLSTMQGVYLTEIDE